MRRPGSKQRRLVILLLALLTFGLAYYAGNKHKDPDLPVISGILLHPPTTVPEFALTDQQGEPFSAGRLLGRWSLIVLDPAPGTRSPAFIRLVQVHNRLAAEQQQQRQTHFIYLPREGSDEIDAAVERLGEGFYALSGGASEIAAAFRHFGVETIRNGFTLYLVGPQARMQALFTDAQDAATIAVDLQTLTTHQR